MLKNPNQHYLGNGCYANPQPNGLVKVVWFENYCKRRTFRSINMEAAQKLAIVLGRLMPWPDRGHR